MSIRKREWVTRTGERKQAWIVDYSQDGQRHIQTFQRKKDADAYAQQVGVEIRAGTHTPVSKSITVTQAAEDWINSVALDKREASTIAQYRQHARHINARVGNVKLASLTTPRLNAVRDELLNTMSAAMARKVISSLKSLLREAQRRGNVAQNVALSVKRIDPDKRATGKLRVGIDIPTIEEIKAIINAAGPHKPFLMTAAFAGLRASELRGLRWSDVDLRKGELHVRQRADRYNAIGKPKSTAGSRSVPLGPLLLNVLREWKLVCPKGEHGLVFPTASGQIAGHNNLVRAFKATVRKAGLTDAKGKPKYSKVHSLRHFYASWCNNPPEDGGQGLPPKVVQTQLGHASIVMTMDTYGHLFPAGKDAQRRLAEAEHALLS
jgi:integrase